MLNKNDSPGNIEYRTIQGEITIDSMGEYMGEMRKKEKKYRYNNNAF